MNTNEETEVPGFTGQVMTFPESNETISATLSDIFKQHGVQLDTAGNILADPHWPKYIDSLRNVGISWAAAFKDLLDNCSDAAATKMNIWTMGTKVKNGRNHVATGVTDIIIADNGCGMDWYTLYRALILGSDCQKYTQTSKGIFGVGLDHATISMARNTTVLSKAKGGTIHKLVLDIDEIQKSGKFVLVAGDNCPITEEERAMFGNPDYVDSNDHGTIVHMRGLDLLKTKDASWMAKNLLSESHLPRTFRMGLSDGVFEIYVNGEAVEPYDADGWDLPDTERLTPGEWVTDSIFDPENPFEYRLSLQLPKTCGKSGGSPAQRARNGKQGVNVLRADREIKFGVTLGLWQASTNFVGFQLSIRLNPSHDDWIGTDTKKDGVNLREDFFKYLKKMVSKYKTEAGKLLKAQAHAEVKPEIASVQDEVAEAMSGISHKLQGVPETPKRVYNRTGDHTGKQSQSKNYPRSVPPHLRTQSGDYNWEYILVDGVENGWGPNGPWFDVDLELEEGTRKWKYTVYLNTDHPFVEGQYIDSDKTSEEKHSFLLTVSSIAILKSTLIRQHIGPGNSFDESDLNELFQEYSYNLKQFESSTLLKKLEDKIT